jgi:aspartate-semialdehyde dehydrogenase
MNKIKVGILGATGMVGRRFVSLLANHPWFEVTLLAASFRSAGRPYRLALENKGLSQPAIDDLCQGQPALAGILVENVSNCARLAGQVGLVFCALDMPKAQIAELEEQYARREVAVISNNSAHRSTPDVPVIIPEVNPGQSEVIHSQRRRLRTARGFIAAKPNCSLQSFVPPLEALRDLQPYEVFVSTYQALSGAGKTSAQWPQMEDNVIPFIGGEEQKTEQEPLKIWGQVSGAGIITAIKPVISAQCVRVNVADGHLATVSVRFSKPFELDEISARWREFRSPIAGWQLPSAPSPFLIYHSQEDRPQPRLDRDAGNGMAISLGRLRPDSIFDCKFVCLSHNTIRGAAGGAILMAEMLIKQGFIS